MNIILKEIKMMSPEYILLDCEENNKFLSAQNLNVFRNLTFRALHCIGKIVSQLPRPPIPNIINLSELF
jgi:hypothetical protein